jgi:hypothetical protein
MRTGRPALTCASALLAAAGTALGAPGAGNTADPIVVDALPYALAATTAGAGAAIDAYSCSPATDESGPELVFRFTLGASARVTAWVEESASVDVDVHLLDDLSVSGGVAQACKSRGNRIAEAELAAGERFVVVDSFEGAAQAGGFVLRVYAIGDAWSEQTVAEGVTWRARRYANQSGGPQVVHELVIDPTAPGLDIRSFPGSGCQTIQTIGEAKQATAGINGGYFGLGGGCPPVSLLKSAGSLLGTNSQKRGAFGVSAAGLSLIDVIAAGADWPAATDAHGGGPVLVKGGKTTTSSDWATESFTSSSFNGPNPRTWAGVDDQGLTHFGTVDGRRPNAAGMGLGPMGQWLASSEVGLADAVNLDGGGSSQLWISGATPNGVVNYPSDNKNAEEPTHSGARACSGGLFVFASPFNHPPRFQTTPPSGATADVPYQYDADAIDLNVDDVLTFSVAKGPVGMSVDPSSGVVSWTPGATGPSSVDVELVVADDAGKQTSQSWTLVIDGATPPADGGVGGSSAADGGAGAGAAGSGGGGAQEGSDEDGCACRAGTRAPSVAWFWPGVLAAVGLAHRRRASRAS